MWPSTPFPICPTTTARSSPTSPARSSSSTTTSTTPPTCRGQRRHREAGRDAQQGRVRPAAHRRREEPRVPRLGAPAPQPYWVNMSPDGGEPDGGLAAAIDEHLGSVDNLKAQMEAVVATVQGSGWAALSWEPFGQRLVVQQILDHQETTRCVAGSLPLLRSQLRCLGARLLPAVQEREGRLRQGVLEHRELGRRRRPLREDPGRGAARLRPSASGPRRAVRRLPPP